jgi:hypothetical protein
MPDRRTAITWQEQARATLSEFFVDHPHSLGESYWEHQTHATRFGATLIAAGIACLVHGVVPGLFARTGSSAVASLYEQMRARTRLAGPLPAQQDARGGASLHLSA